MSYKLIRRFISSKEFETPFGLRLLANILNHIIHTDDTHTEAATTFNIRHDDSDNDPHDQPDSNAHNSPKSSSCDLSSNVSENTVLYDMSPSKNAEDTEREELDAHKETFFTSSDSGGSGSSWSEVRRRENNRRRTKRKRGRTKEGQRKNSAEDALGKELRNLLRMTDVSPSGRAGQASDEEETREEEAAQQQRSSKKSGATGKKEEMSLLDCLNAVDSLEEDSKPEPETGESGKDFLSVVNREMKRAFLQSSDDDDDAGEAGEDEKEDKRKKNPVEGDTTEEKWKTGGKDELGEFRFPAVSKHEQTSKRPEPAKTKKNDDITLSEDDSCSSVEYVEHVRRKPPGKEDQISDADSASQTQSPKGRKNINKILKKDSLQVETKQALKMETERKKRVDERMKTFEKLLPDTSSKLVLDLDAHTREELLVVDDSLSGQLKPHQKEGVRFMWNCCFESMKRLEEDSGSGCVLAHCMGLGKTLQVITLVHTVLTQNTGVQTVMIMCPLNTLRNWSQEFRTWQKNCGKKVRVVDLIPCRSENSRVAKVRWWRQQGGVLLLSYDMFRRLIKTNGDEETEFSRGFLDPGPDLVVCDEGHVLKNNSSALSRSISRIKTLRRIILTGTPLQNNLMEYYCMVQFVKPNILGTKKEFMNRFVHPINNGQFEDSTQRDVRLMKRRAHVLHTMLDGFIQRRGYYVLRPFLPEKQEYVISIALTETQENIYGLSIGRCKEAARLLRDFQWMQKVWTHPRLMRSHSRKSGEEHALQEWEQLVREEEYERIDSSGKLVLLFSILKRCREIGDKVLVFSQSLNSLDLIEHFLRKMNGYHSSGLDVAFADKWVPGEDYFRLDGSTSSDNRQLYCQGFNRVDEGGARLFLISTKAGGLGINLVAANRVVVFDASWNPTHDVQSIFRVYRFGQRKICYIYRFLAAATMEEKIYRRQVTKLSLAHRILDEHQIERHYTMGNLQELYRYDPLPKSEWRVPKIPKDGLFAEILATNRDIIVGYHEHDSLLENKEEEELTEEERQAAWEDYEKEKLTPEYPPQVLNGDAVPSAPPIGCPNAQGVGAGPRVQPPPPYNPHGSLVSQGGNDLCKIVEVRTLSGEGGVRGRRPGVAAGVGNRLGGLKLENLLEFADAMGMKKGEGENFDRFCRRIMQAVKTVFPWGISGGLVRGNVNGVNGI